MPWIRWPLYIRQREEERLELEIRAAHKRTRQTYGSERLQRDFSDNGVCRGRSSDQEDSSKAGLALLAETR